MLLAHRSWLCVQQCAALALTVIGRPCACSPPLCMCRGKATQLRCLCALPRRVVDGAASRLAPVLAALQRLVAPPRGNRPLPPSLYMRIQHLHAACEAMNSCLHLAAACGSSSEAQLQLARVAIGSVVCSGHDALTAWGPWLASGLNELWQACGVSLDTQLRLAVSVMSAPGWSAAAAAEAAPPAQLAAWLAAAARMLKRLGERSGTGRQLAL